jgi:hypothetical protein
VLDLLPTRRGHANAIEREGSIRDPLTRSMDGQNRYERPAWGAGEFWSRDWAGKSSMAIEMRDPVLGAPAMRALHATIRNHPPPLEPVETGHFNSALWVHDPLGLFSPQDRPEREL